MTGSCPYRYVANVCVLKRRKEIPYKSLSNFKKHERPYIYIFFLHFVEFSSPGLGHRAAVFLRCEMGAFNWEAFTNYVTIFHIDRQNTCFVAVDSDILCKLELVTLSLILDYFQI